MDIQPRLPSAPFSAPPGGRTVADGLSRLGLVAGIWSVAAGFAVLTSLVEDFGVQNSPGGDPLTYFFTGVLALLSFAVWIGCRRGAFTPAAFARVALGYELVIACILGSAPLGWQWGLGPEALEWLAAPGPRPWSFGNQVPWVGVWVMFFATLIPLSPRQHLFGAVLSALTVPAWSLLSPILTGFPVALEVERGRLTLLAVLVVSYPTLIATGMAYFAARHVHGLSRALAQARQLGSYHLIEKLGQGGMGEVWLAEHRMLARSAALKLIRTDGSGTPLSEGTLKRFEREVRAAAQLRSPHTIEVYDYGLTEDGTFYYVMERLDGLDLDQLVKRYGAQPWGRVVRIVRQVCHSLGEAHAAGMVHRDIKPANVFLCRLGRDLDQVKVLDFGLVKGGEPGFRSAELTHAGAFIGTPAYASPEMARGGASTVDGRSDIYALGCVAWFLLTGRPVFEADTVMDLLMKHVGEQPLPPSALAGGVPPALDEAILACLAKDPDDRTASPDVLLEALSELDSRDSWSRDQEVAWWAKHPPRAPASESDDPTERH